MCKLKGFFNPETEINPTSSTSSCASSGISEFFAVVKVDFGAKTLDMPETSSLSLMSKIMLNLSCGGAAVYY